MIEVLLSAPVLVALLMVAIATMWLHLKKAKHPRYSLPLTSIPNAKSVEYDVIVIGAGPAGVAAAGRAHKKGLSVLLIEEGPIGIARGPFATADLPSFSLETIGSIVDSGNERATLPLASALPNVCLTSSSDTPPQPLRSYTDVKVRYSRGHGLGGTTMIDWCQLFTSPYQMGKELVMCVKGAGSSQLLEQRVPFALPKIRSPLSWAFSCAVSSSLEQEEPTGEDPTQWGASTKEHAISGQFPPQEQGAFTTPCRISSLDSLRISIIRALIGKRPSKALKGLSVLAAAKVVGFTTEAVTTGSSKSVTCVNVRVPKERGLVKIGEGSIEVVNDGKEMLIPLRCRKGVVICAGALHTPSLLRMLVPHDGPLPMNDVVGFPMIFQTRPGLSSDPSNAHSWRSLVSWFINGTGPALSPISDTAAVLDVPTHPGARLMIQLVPTGGFNRRRFAALGISLPLGVFKEGIILYVSLISLPTDEGRKLMAGGLSIGQLVSDEGGSPLISGNFDQNHDLRKSVIECLSYGVPLCRSLVQTQPLSAFCEQEALDTSLFNPKERDLVVRTLYQSTAKAQKLTPHQQQQGKDIASKLGTSEEYIKYYVAKHARFMGYLSGTATPFMRPSTTAPHTPSQMPDSRVCGLRNVFVGDASRVPIEEVAGTILSFGGTAAAMSLGASASDDLLKAI